MCGKTQTRITWNTDTSDAVRAGHINRLIYHAPSANNLESKIKNFHRNVIWFNPPCVKNVTTRLDQSFFHIIGTHFPKNHTFSKTFNRNKVIVSYGCMQDIKTINRELLKEYQEIKKSNLISKVTWSIVRECPSYNLSKKQCYLCLEIN